MKKLSFFLCFLFSGYLNANNLQISNLSVSLPNVSFTIQWDNSWNTTNNINPLYPNNWDGVWVFVKYQNNIDNLWKHATLSAAASDHSISGGVLEVNPVQDGMGVFIRRSAPGAGNIAATTVSLKMNALTGTGDFNFRVFGTEMVYMPQASFELGDGNVNGANYFTPVTVGAANQSSGFAAGSLFSASPAVPAAFPNGYAAAYMMKYEITCEQWVDFVNTLTYDQQATRMDVVPNSAANTLAYTAGGYFNYSVADNAVKIKTSGQNNTRPAILGCDLNGNNVYGENGDGQNMVVSFINKGDLLSYLDWSGLRPMTEMEFEKACRGTLSRVASEYAWGNTSGTYLYRSNLSNPGTAEESYAGAISNGLCMFYGYYAGNISINIGPARAGVFASSSSGRASSGAGFYGAMELSGNAAEMVVSVDAKGVLFTGSNGDGSLSAAGQANQSNWPSPLEGLNSGIMLRGGDFYNYDLRYIQTSFRGHGSVDIGRVFNCGGRGIRTAP